MKWLVRFSRERSGKGMAEKLAAELIAAAKVKGAAVKGKKTHTGWLKPTERLRISVLNLFFITIH